MKTTKLKTIYICKKCQTEYPKWQGKCSACNEWNSLQEDVIPFSKKNITKFEDLRNVRLPQPLDQIELGQEVRIPLIDGEMNRVLDGGIVPGSLTLLGGEPGIGKSTLLIQIAIQLAPNPVLYISGEESERQIKMRADRIPGTNPNLYVYSETSLERIFQAIMDIEPILSIIDSIQTVSTEELEMAPGSIGQIRECTSRIMRMAKDNYASIILVGHITKEGSLAGPKALEHMVDTVLEFEGDRHNNYRIIRSSKNRFGATPELGIYEMRQNGLREVSNPSEIFLNQSDELFAGVAVASTLQGLRPFLIETQALVTPATYGNPQRSATGFDLRRMSMLLAILEKKCGFKLGDKDVFINLAGGVKMEDPALDLSLVCAIISSMYENPISKKICFAAEVGLTGEVRAVSRIDQRISESEKLGFDEIFISSQQSPTINAESKIKITSVSKLTEVFRSIFG